MTAKISYWMAFAHAQHFSNRRKMQFLVEVVHEKIPLEEAMKKVREGERDLFDFKDKEWEGLRSACEEIPNYSFLAEQLLEQGIRIIHVMEKEAYPATLKENMKMNTPVLIYAKGNAELLHEKSIAIVGARNASGRSLTFTDKIAARGVEEGYVIVSGFAKGVDRQALDSALKHKGRSIIVLPQGIDTFRNRTYYADILKRNILAISTYHPSAAWSVGLAMDRNKTIYGLAGKIYVAESGSSGGTWEGVLQGLKSGRKIFVRKAFPDEKNANNILISKGAIPVDEEGNEISEKATEEPTVAEPSAGYPKTSKDYYEQEIIERTLEELRKRKGKGITSKEITQMLHLDEKSSRKLNRILSSSKALRKEKKGRYNFFHLSGDSPTQKKLF